MPTPAPSRTPHPALPAPALGWYVGQSSWFATQEINNLPVRPRIVNYYSSWLKPFNTSFAQDASADGIVPFVEMEPWHCTGCQGG